MNHNFLMVGAETDGIKFNKADGSPFSESEIKKLISEINAMLPEKINYDLDSVLDKILIIKKKNYITVKDGKLKFKGSSIIDSKKEPALLEFMKLVINELLDSNPDGVVNVYERYVQEAMNVKDITRWACKRTISKAVLESDRANEAKIYDAIKNKERIQEGDKVYLYTSQDGMKQDSAKGELVFLKNGTPRMVPNFVLKMVEDYNNDHSSLKLIERIYDTLTIFEQVLDMNKFKKYYLKKEYSLLVQQKDSLNE